MAGESSAHRTTTALPVWLLLGAAILGMVSLHAHPLLHPWLFDDDFALLTASWDWSSTRHYIWVPFDDNVWPLERLTSYLVVNLSGRVTAFPRATSFLGPIAVSVAMVLVYLFVRREMGHPLYGLVAAIVFGVSLKYNQAVFWYAATFLAVMLDTLLLALLAAQSWRLTGRKSSLAWCIFWVALAPGWFPSGILAGPLCCLYLLPRENEHEPAPFSWSRCLKALWPLLGSVAYLGISLPQNLDRLFVVKRVGGQSLTETFSPLLGLLYTLRSIVDNLVFGVVGASGATCPVWLLPLPLLVIGLAGWWWWRQAPRRRLMVLGCGLIFLSYWLTLSARAVLPYEGQEHSLHERNRYNLLPFLGLVLFAGAGLPSRQGTLFQLDPSGRLTRGQVRALAVLLAILVGLQFPVSWIGHQRTDYDAAEQMAVLRHIEEVDARCQTNRISAPTAREALGFLEIPLSTTPGSGYPPRINGWQWLKGSDDPLPYEDLNEVRRLLNP